MKKQHVLTTCWATAALALPPAVMGGGCAPTPATEAPGTVPAEMVIFPFSGEMPVGGWQVEDDAVMGGVSEGAFRLNEKGHVVFSGTVSLENNGGFSSVQYDFKPIDVSAYGKAVLRIKGDGKQYQFRIESGANDRHAYVYPFETTGKWQTVEIPFNKMYPQWRGNRLDLPNFRGDVVRHVRFLIANGRAESFRLEVESVTLR